MQHGHRSGDDDDVLGGLSEAWTGDADGVVAERDSVELEFAIGVGGGGFAPVRRFCFEHDHGFLDGAMLRVVHDAANGAIDVGECHGRDENEADD